MSQKKRLSRGVRSSGSMPIALFITIMFIALSVGIIGVVTSQIAQNKQAENQRIAHEALGSSIAIAAEQIGPAARVLTNLPTVEPSTWTALNNDNNNSFYRWWVSSSSNAILNSSNLPTGTWASATFGNNIWVAINTAGTAFTSPDGVTWTQRNNLPNAGSLVYSNVTYGLGKFVATSSTASTNIATSVDGITWSSVTIASGTYIPACSTTTCVFLSTTAAAGYYSANLVNFTAIPTVPFIAKDVVFSVTNFVMSGTNSIATSPTGATWTSRAISAHVWGLVGAINGTLVAATTAAAGSTVIATSTNNGVTWVDSVLPQSGNWVAISTAGPQIALFSGPISGTNQSSYLASSDGLTWISNVLPSGAPWTGVASNNRSFLLYQSTNPSYLIPITTAVSANQQITVTSRVQQGRVSDQNNGQYIASMTYNWNIAQKRWIPSKFVGTAAMAVTLGPNPPTSVIGTRTAPGTIVVSWTPPIDTGSSAIVSYLATSSPGGYYCGNGGQLDGTTCTLTTSSPATYNGSFYSCTAPDVLVGVTCKHTATYTANYSPISYKCNNGDSPSGTQATTFTCTRNYSASVSQAAIYNCPNGYSPSGNQSSAVSCTQTYAMHVTVHAIWQCPAGYSPSGDQLSAVDCTQDYTSPKTQDAIYTCPIGYSPTGPQSTQVSCTKSYTEFAPACTGDGTYSAGYCIHNYGPAGHGWWDCTNKGIYSNLAVGGWVYTSSGGASYPNGRCIVAADGNFDSLNNRCQYYNRIPPPGLPVAVSLTWGWYGGAYTNNSAHWTSCATSSGSVSANDIRSYCGFYGTSPMSLNSGSFSQYQGYVADDWSAGGNGGSCFGRYVNTPGCNDPDGGVVTGGTFPTRTCTATKFANETTTAHWDCNSGDSAPDGFAFGSAYGSFTCTRHVTATMTSPWLYGCFAGDTPAGNQLIDTTCTTTTTASLTQAAIYQCLAGDSPGGNQSSAVACTGTYSAPLFSSGYYSCNPGDTPSTTSAVSFTCTATTYPAANFSAAYYSCGAGSLSGNVCLTTSTYSGSYNAGGYTCASGTQTSCTITNMVDGVYTFTVQATNSEGTSLFSTASNMVSPMLLSINYPSTIFSTTQSGQLMVPVITGSSGATIAYSESGALPAGVTFDNATGIVTGRASWASQAGFPFTITVTATDSLTGLSAVSPVTFTLITP